MCCRSAAGLRQTVCALIGLPESGAESRDSSRLPLIASFFIFFPSQPPPAVAVTVTKQGTGAHPLIPLLCVYTTHQMNGSPESGRVQARVPL